LSITPKGGDQDEGTQSYRESPPPTHPATHRCVHHSDASRNLQQIGVVVRAVPAAPPEKVGRFHSGAGASTAQHAAFPEYPYKKMIAFSGA
jgi:hypothetical protein